MKDECEFSILNRNDFERKSWGLLERFTNSSRFPSGKLVHFEILGDITDSFIQRKYFDHECSAPTFVQQQLLFLSKS